MIYKRMDKKPVAELRKMLKEKRGSTKAPSKMSKHEILMELEGHKGSSSQHEMAIQTEEAQHVTIPVARRKLRKEDEAKPEKKTMKIDIGEIPARRREVATQTDDMSHRILVPTKKGIKSKPAYVREYETSSEEETEREVVFPANRKTTSRAEQIRREHEIAKSRVVARGEDVRGHETDMVRHNKIAKRIAASYPTGQPRVAANEQREEGTDVKSSTNKLVKGSQEARDFMARIRMARKLKKESID